MNMSYCRFQNTLHDFRDCVDDLRNNGLEDLSQEEFNAFVSLALEAQDFVFMIRELHLSDEEIEYTRKDLLELQR